MDHLPKVVVRFVVSNYVANPTQRLALKSSIVNEPYAIMDKSDHLWELDVDLTGALLQAVKDRNDMGLCITYRYLVINGDGTTTPDVLERTLPHMPPMQSIYDQCVSALALHPQYKALIENPNSVMEVRFTIVDDWSFSSSVPWNTSAMRIMLEHHLKIEKSVLDSGHLLNKLFNRCFWTIEDSLDVANTNTASILKEAKKTHNQQKNLALLKASKVVEKIKSDKMSSKLIRSNVVKSHLIPVLFTCHVPYIFKWDRVVLTGSLPRFGNWNPHSRSSISLNHVGNRRFEAPTVFYFTLDEIRTFQYKFVICHPDGNVSFESGENRSIHLFEDLCGVITLTADPSPLDQSVKTTSDLYSIVSPSKQEVSQSSPIFDTVEGVTSPSAAQSESGRPQSKSIQIKYYSYFINSFLRYPYTAMPRFTSLCVPLSSLRSALSTGIGDFGDLRMLANFTERCGINIIQLLPLQDTITNAILSPTGTNSLSTPFSKADSSPYNNISAFALHPVYIRVEQIPDMNAKIISRLNCFRHQISKDIHYLHCKYNYGKACREKLNFLYDVYSSIIEDTTLSAQVMKIMTWICDTPLVKYWIYSYMLYRYLVDVFNGLDFIQGLNNLSENDAQQLKGFLSLIGLKSIDAISPRDSGLYIDKLYDRISASGTVDKDAEGFIKHIFFYAFLQMHAHKQLKDSADYCRAKGICLAGDLAFGTSPMGVDHWVYPEYFDDKWCIGAPPDSFSTTGQNWGYPAYKWDVMEKGDNYRWFRERFRHLELFFDCIRIDHILGWFRMWTLPSTSSSQNGALGQFVPAAPLHWDWIFAECYDPASPIPWCRSKDAIRERLTKPQLTQSLAHKLCGDSGEDLVCSTLVDLNLLSYNGKSKSYEVKHTEQDACNLLDSYLAEKEINLELYSILKEAYLKLICNVCLVADTYNSDAYCHPLFANKCIETEMTSLSNLEHEALRNKIRHWSHEYFSTWHNDEWTRNGTKHLKLITESTNMMIFGEDLGFLHPCIRRVMADTGIIGLRVQRMVHEGYPSQFYRCDDDSVYSYLTVAAPSTHDTYPLRAWWEHNRSAACAFWRERLGHGEYDDWQIPYSLSEADCCAILRQNLHSKSIICCLMLQDIFGVCEKYRYNGDTQDEIINKPGERDWTWKYRIHISLEELHNSDLVGIIGDEIKGSGRVLQ